MLKIIIYLVSPRQRSNASARILFSVFCLYAFAAAGLNSACRSNQTASPASTKDTEQCLTERIKPALPPREPENSILCDNLVNRVNELDLLIMRQEQAEQLAFSRAKESCRGDSAVDCRFWTQRAYGFSVQTKELREEHRELMAQKAQNGCHD